MTDKALVLIEIHAPLEGTTDPRIVKQRVWDTDEAEGIAAEHNADHWYITEVDPVSKWATIYAITRHYGGPEEGGWWYDWRELIESVEIGGDVEFEAIKDVLLDRYADHKWGSLSSVNGGQDIEVLGELWSGQYASKERPHYE